MNVEIISIGTELLLGDVVDTNSTYIARNLTALGYDIHHISTVGDNKKRLCTTLNTAKERSDIIITTGGLGPTEDDITREAVAEVSGCPLYQDQKLKKNIERYFHEKNYNLTENNYRQANLPETATPLGNDWGTAPGILLELKNITFISLPGVPREMKNMFKNDVITYLQQQNDKVILSRELNFFGIGESTLETKITDILHSQSNPTLALLAGSGEVKIRITAKADSEGKAEKLIAGSQKNIENRVGGYIYGIDSEGLAAEAGKLLKNKNMKLSVAESCTGGLVGDRLTDIPGSSNFFIGGIVAYSNQIKEQILQVKKETLKIRGAVSGETAAEMAAGIKKLYNTDIGLALTGIAGPGGGTREKPVGLVYIGIAAPDGIQVHQLNLKGDRRRNKWMSSQYALFYLIQKIKENNYENN